MTEITVISGKGGTGKTSITAALASILPNAVFCDNDVDAADLHLIFQPKVIEEHIFEGAWVATVNPDTCTNCGICENYCRYDAISELNNSRIINPIQCEGCRLCERVCPEKAISSARSTNNQWFVSETRFGPLVHAHMGPGEENSGKLVTQVRRKAREIAKKIKADYIINDGPPGIGCAAISSLSGVDMALLVIEPTKSGKHDILRLIELIEVFKLPAKAIINKHDLSPKITDELSDFLKKKGIPLIAKIPFNQIITQAQIEGQNIIEFAPNSPISKSLISAKLR